METETKKLLFQYLTPVQIETWFKLPSVMFGGLTPRQMFDANRGEEVFNKLKSVYKDTDSGIRIGDPESP